MTETKPADLITHDASAFDNRVTLTFDLSTAGSMRPGVLAWSICVPSLMLIARSVFLLQRRQTHRRAKLLMPLITL